MMSRYKILFLLFLATNFPSLPNAAATCNRNSGPSGVNECVRLTPYYSKYQWATCLTNVYIQVLSNYKAICRDKIAKYCWYQCMMERHIIDAGPVYNDCLCGSDTPTNVSTTVGPSTTPLPSWCYSPDGTKCSWYRECLEVRHPCENTESRYAVTYAEKFCNLYTNNYDDFSTKGQNWINAVRKCLQVALVPTLRQYATDTCEDIANKAFDSHTPCYVRPSPGKPSSVCDLPCLDLWRIFWTIKSSFTTGAWDRSMKGALSTFAQCGYRGCTKKMIKVSLMLVLFHQPYLFGKRSVDPEIRYEARAGELVDEISKILNWNLAIMLWYAEATRDATNRTKPRDELSVDVLLASKRDFDLNNQNALPANLNATVEELVDAVKSGRLRNIRSPSSSENFRLETVASCDDGLACNMTTIQARHSGSTVSTSLSSLLCFALWLLPNFQHNFQPNTASSVTLIKADSIQYNSPPPVTDQKRTDLASQK